MKPRKGQLLSIPTHYIDNDRYDDGYKAHMNLKR